MRTILDLLLQFLLTLLLCHLLLLGCGGKKDSEKSEEDEGEDDDKEEKTAKNFFSLTDRGQSGLTGAGSTYAGRAGTGMGGTSSNFNRHASLRKASDGQLGTQSTLALPAPEVCDTIFLICRCQ